MSPSTEVPAVRLASGVEPQRKWSLMDAFDKSKSNEEPKLIEFSPSFGNKGTIITVVLQTLPSQMPVKLAFNSLMVETKQLQAQDITSLVATVPSFQETHSATPSVPISVCFFDGELVTSTWMVAEFTFDLSDKQTTTCSIEQNSIVSFDKDDTRLYQHLYSQPPYNLNQVPYYQPYVYQQQQASNQRNLLLDRYHRQLPYQGYGQSPLHFFPSGNTNGFANMLGTSMASHYPTLPVQPKPRRQRHSNANTAFGFKSTIHIPTTSVANYQPYPGLVSRANLDISGDLDAMTKSWTPDEWSNRRRLVQFWREQDSNKITTTFQPVPQGERATHIGNIVVSCIYWTERDDFFITSVDGIYLLECLMDVRFSVEEKNRIRRNLEGFRPLTVSKCKGDSAEFFKLIMSFPNPKPRNIEKDVKVFHWKTLPYALKKIVAKYTAYSQKPSTAIKDVVASPQAPS